jgi:hypothetical protein
MTPIRLSRSKSIRRHALSFARFSVQAPKTPDGATVAPWIISQTDTGRIFKTWWRESTKGQYLLFQPTIPEVTATRSVLLPFWAFTASVTVARCGVSRKYVTPAPVLQIYAGSQYLRKNTDVRNIVKCTEPCSFPECSPFSSLSHHRC